MDALDGDALRVWIAMSARALYRHQDEINDLNVYPIPDRDTGTNMAMTMQSAADVMPNTAVPNTAVPNHAPTDAAGTALALMANGAILGARGNSGVILAELLRGLADSSGPDAALIGPKALAAGLAHAVSCAYAAVGDPVEGTILSVARAAADEAAAAGDELSSVARAALAGATSALLRTTGQLDALRAAGVVDAGGRGLVLVSKRWHGRSTLRRRRTVRECSDLDPAAGGPHR